MWVFYLVTKMKGILVQQKISKVIDNTFTTTMTVNKKKEFDKLAYI